MVSPVVEGTGASISGVQLQMSAAVVLEIRAHAVFIRSMERCEHLRRSGSGIRPRASLALSAHTQFICSFLKIIGPLTE